MLWDVYLENLQILNSTGNPSFDQVKAVCPHLDETLVREFYELRHGEGSNGLIPAPPLRVNGSYQGLWLKSFNDPEPHFFVSVGAHRLRGSHKAVPEFDEGLGEGLPYARDAIAYAQKHWPEHLVDDTWQEFYFELEISPARLKNSDSLVFVAFISRRGWWSDLEIDHSAPTSQLVNDVIQEITTNKLIAEEVRGNRIDLPYTMRQKRTRIGINSALPKVVTDLLISEGYQFNMDPDLEREKEATIFEERYSHLR